MLEDGEIPLPRKRERVDYGDISSSSPPSPVINMPSRLMVHTPDAVIQESPVDRLELEVEEEEEEEEEDVRQERQRQERKKRRLEILSKYAPAEPSAKAVVLPVQVEHATRTTSTSTAPIQHAVDEEDDMFAVDYKEQPAQPEATTLILQREECDDAEGYYKHLLGEVLDGRYRVSSLIGQGVFSTVVLAVDTTTSEQVAIKIIRSNETMYRAGCKEITLLERLNRLDQQGKKHVIRFLRSFEHRHHLCLVFESLGMNLRQVLKKYGGSSGLNLKGVRSYAQQLFLALALLHKANILHADIKPDNILVNAQHTALKLCDFGSASDAQENDITPYLVSRFYRAPEIILGIPYTPALDVWSVACTLYELYTGRILFAGKDNNHMLHLHMELKGRFNGKMIKRGEFSARHFDADGNFLQHDVDKLTNEPALKVTHVPAQPTKDLKSRLYKNTSDLTEGDKEMLQLFVDFLDKCLTLSPDKRLTPKEALQHPFLKHPTSYFTRV